MTINLRGHHLQYLQNRLSRNRLSRDDFFWDRAGSVDKYGIANIINHYKILRRIVSGNETIVISDSLDDICKQCNNKDKTCSSTAYVDRAYARIFGFELGKEYRAEEVVREVGHRSFTFKDFVRFIGAYFMEYISNPRHILRTIRSLVPPLEVFKPVDGEELRRRTENRKILLFDQIMKEYEKAQP